MTNRFDFRLAIGAQNGPRSSSWHFWSRKAHVYACSGGLGGVQKFSFHPPNICRLATPKERAPLIAEGQNRAMHEWKRDPTPPAGSDKVVRVLRVGFATDLLSTSVSETSKKPVNWVAAAPSGGATAIDLCFTREPEELLRERLRTEPPEHNHLLLAYRPLPNGEAFYVTSWFALNKGNDMLRMPARHGHKRDLIISPNDPLQTGRPVRLTLFSNPKDGDLIWAWEYGGYWTDPVPDQLWEAQCAAFRASNGDARLEGPGAVRI